MSNLGSIWNNEEFFKRREHLLKNKPKCPACGKKLNVNIYIQLTQLTGFVLPTILAGIKKCNMNDVVKATKASKKK